MSPSLASLQYRPRSIRFKKVMQAQSVAFRFRFSVFSFFSSEATRCSNVVVRLSESVSLCRYSL
jgi:hypothetical protein